jgi:hypothetical protein
MLVTVTGWTSEGWELESRWGEHVIQTESGAHPASYPMGTGSKAVGAWSSALTSN